MTSTIVVALNRFLPEAEKIAGYIGADVKEYTPEIFSEIFPVADRIVAVMSMGIAVRKIAPLLSDKWKDPAIVIVSPDFRYAIPLVGGHHGANDLAKELQGIGLVPVITTATEAIGRDSVEGIAQRTGTVIANRDSTRAVNAALLDSDIPVHAVKGPALVLVDDQVSILARKGDYTVGVGCRKGVSSAEVEASLRQALADAGISPDQVSVFSTTAKKFGETGLREGVAAMSAPLIFLDDDTINAQEGLSPSKAKRIGLRGVAEPCALAVSKRKELLMKKKAYGRVTVAIAR